MSELTSSRIPGYQLDSDVTRQHDESVSPTAMPVFMGYVQQVSDEDLGKPRLIQSYTEFEKLYCTGFNDEDLNPWSNSESAPNIADFGPFLRSSISLYFQNGGGPCYVLAVGRLDAYTPPHIRHFNDALKELAAVSELTLILPTDAILLPEHDYYALCQALLKHCAKLLNRFCLFDAGSLPMEGGGSGAARARKFCNSLGQSFLAFGASYYPYLQIRPKYERAVGEEVGSESKLGLPSAVVAAACYVSDLQRGVWKTPANIQVKGVVGIAPQPSLQEMGRLYEPDNGRSCNLIRMIPGRGVYVWGARTMAGKDPEWRYINVRRLVSFLEAALRDRSQFAVFEPNSIRTWIIVKGICDSFLRDLWEAGGLAGNKREDAYQVNIGEGETMSEADVKEGRMIVLIRVAPKIPAEFITLKIFHQVQALGIQ